MMVVVQLRSARVPPRLAAKVRARGATLQPMHPGCADPALATFFYADVFPPETAHELATLLQTDDSVEAAYVKPQAEVP
jgi:hypothetical protein